jgi:hypothetical protein
VKFGRRNSWVEVGRRLLAERFAEQDEALIQEERNALLQVAQGLPETPVDGAAEEYMETVSADADPTQMVLTVLGRFNRAVAKAESNPQGRWTDECIEQIVAGIEIAVRNRWDNLREALTDTARILQTYEDADIPYEAVYFLKDSYEILCLMVGDLIVDNVRSGAMNKWRERYHLAVKELERFGLEPIPDEMPEEAPMPAAPVASVGRGQIIPFHASQRRDEAAAFDLSDEPAPAPADDHEARAGETETLEDDTPYVPEVPEVEAELSIEAEDRRVYVADEMMEDETEEAPALWSVPQEAHDEKEEAEAAAEEGIAQEMLLFEEATDAEAATATQEAEEAMSAETARIEEWTIETATDEEQAALEDEMAAEVECEAPETLRVGFSPAAAEMPELDGISPEEAEAAAEDALAALAPRSGAGTAVEAQEADLFSGIEEAFAEEAPLEEAPLEARSAPVEVPRPAASVSAGAVPAQAAAAPPAEGTPEHLLYSAQAAMARGDIASAKLLALQVAADMARLEAERAAVELGRAKSLREETSAHIQAAQREVATAEASLGARVQARATQERALAAKHAEIRGIEESIAEIEQGIRHIDEQIARLQAQREAEVERLGEVQAVDAAERREADRLREDIEVLGIQEQDAEQALRAARSRVAALEEERSAREAAIREAEAALAARLEAVADIDGTMNHMRAAAGV